MIHPLKILVKEPSTSPISDQLKLWLAPDFRYDEQSQLLEISHHLLQHTTPRGWLTDRTIASSGPISQSQLHWEQA
jgi:hypothetical protein